MNIKNFLSEKKAVSPVIGVILMVAITVILAAVIGTFVLGLGQQVQETTPQASFGFEYDQATSGHDSLEITHDGGDSIAAVRLSVKQSGATDGNDGDGAELVSDNSWSNLGGPDPAEAGSTLVLDEGDFNGVAGGGGGTLDQLDLSSASVKVVWTGQSGDNTATLGEWDGPDA